MRDTSSLHTAIRRTALVLGLSVASVSMAQVDVGAAVHYGGSFTVNVHADIHMFEAIGLDHAIRPGISYAFAGLPAVSVSYVVSDAPTLWPDLTGYLGVGAGISFPGEPLDRVMFSGHALAGVSVPFADRWSGFIEGTFTTSSLGNGVAVGLGARYRFGGN